MQGKSIKTRRGKVGTPVEFGANCRILGVRITSPPLSKPIPNDLAVIRKQYSF
jgi:hypothetical protein